MQTKTEDDGKSMWRRIMSMLFSYCIPYDNGAAPNPFWGLCTLAICKPAIRRVAEIGDWVVGTGSKKSLVGDVSGKVVYAMLVTQKKTMEEYDQFTRSELPNKIPKMDHTDSRRWHGDSIYDFSTPIPSLHPSVHNERHRSTDLIGRFVLLSNHFFYFGDQPVTLPRELRDIAQQQRGYRSHLNAPYVDAFVRWIESLGYPCAVPIGNPQWWSLSNFQASCDACATSRWQEDEADLAETEAPCSNS
jgi:hypothetical protein